MRRLTVGCVALLTLVGAARADLLPPGMKGVTHDRFVDNTADYKDYLFYVSAYEKTPPGAFGGVAHQPWDPLGEKGRIERTIFSSFNRTSYLYAIPKKVVDGAKGKAVKEWFDGSTPGVIKSTAPLDTLHVVPEASRAARLESHFRAVLQDNRLRVETVSQKAYDSQGKEVAWPRDKVGLLDGDGGPGLRYGVAAAGLSVAVVLALGGLAWRRRRVG